MYGRTVTALVFAVFALWAFVPAINRLPHLGYLGFSIDSSRACARVVTTVYEPSRTPLRGGDAIDLRAMSRSERISLAYAIPTTGERFTLPVDRGGTRFVDSATTFPLPQPWIMLLGMYTAISVLWLVFGLLALWFGRDRGSLYAGFFLAASTFGLGAPLEHGRSDLVDVTGAVYDVLLGVGLVALYLLAEELAGSRVPQKTSATLRSAVILATTGLIGYDLANRAFLTFGSCGLPASPVIEVATAGVIVGSALLTLAFGLRDPNGENRLRAQWIFWASAIGLLGPFATAALAILNINDPSAGFADISIIAVPLGFSYATLRYRTFDIEFVLTRAIISVAVVVVLVSAFVVVKAVLKRFVISLDAHAAAIDIGLTIALALSFREVESRIAHFVEQTVFRRKFGAIENVEQVAREATNYVDIETLLQRSVDVVSTAMGASGVAIFVHTDRNYAAVASTDASLRTRTVDADDPAFVSLRTMPVMIDLDVMQSAVAPAGILIPIAAAGRLHGALWCGPRAHGEVYDPDERTGLRHLARDIAVALVAAADRARRNFVTAVASGEIESDAVRAKALALRDRLLMGSGPAKQEEPDHRGMQPL
jgi:hypothetical protein